MEEQGLEQLLQELRNVKGAPFFEALLWKLGEYAGEQAFPDDVSGILFEYQGVA